MPRIFLDSKVVAELCKKHSVKELSFFGSVTRADFGPGSDIDVLVEFEPRAQIGLFELADLKDELSALLGREVDLVTMGMLSPFFREEVLENREIVYVNP